MEIIPPELSKNASNFGHTANVISLLSSEPIEKKEFNACNNFNDEIQMNEVPESGGANIEV